MFKCFMVTTAGIYGKNGELSKEWDTRIGSVYGFTNPDRIKLSKWTDGIERKLKLVLPRPDFHSIEEGSLRDCTNVQEIYIPPTVDYISKGAFQNCKNLECVVIFRSKEAGNLIIGKDAFCGCGNLKNIFVFNNDGRKWRVIDDDKLPIVYFDHIDLLRYGWSIKQTKELYMFMYGESLEDIKDISLDTLLNRGLTIKQANDYFKEAEEER